VVPIKRHPQRNLKRDLSRARSTKRQPPLDDLAGIAKLGEEPLHHRFDLGQDGLPLRPRSHANGQPDMWFTAFQEPLRMNVGIDFQRGTADFMGTARTWLSQCALFHAAQKPYEQSQ